MRSGDGQAGRQAVKRELMIFSLLELVAQRLYMSGFVIEHRTFACIVLIDPVDTAMQFDCTIRPLQRSLEPSLAEDKAPAFALMRIGPGQVGWNHLFPACV